jgi:hypothetical protein
MEYSEQEEASMQNGSKTQGDVRGTKNGTLKEALKTGQTGAAPQALTEAELTRARQQARAAAAFEGSLD